MLLVSFTMTVIGAAILRSGFRRREGRPSQTAPNEAVSQVDAASMLNVSHGSVQNAVVVPGLAEAVERGKDGGRQTIGQRPDSAAQFNADVLAFFRANLGDR
jgi:hypothetical protein